MELNERAERLRADMRNLYAPLESEPIDLDALFDMMVRVLGTDYVMASRKHRAFMPNEYRTYILSHYRYNDLTLQMLARSLHQFTADMRDRHLRFHCENWIDYQNTGLDYRVRAERDRLWVTEARPGCPLRVGDCLLEIQHMTPERIRNYLRGTGFYASEPERELWGGYLRMARNALVRHRNGSEELMLLPHVPETKEQWPIGAKLLGDTVYLKLEHMDRSATEALLRDFTPAIGASRKLILDLRRNVGGDEDALNGLLPFLLDRETTLAELTDEKEYYVNCTATNCELRYRQLSDFLDTLTDTDERALVETERDFYLKNYGRGPVIRRAEPTPPLVFTPAAHAPERVVLLTDTFCEDEGERFVAMAQRCGSKVVTLGRPTMGTLDTFDNITVQLNSHMTISYPIAMTADAYEGRGVLGKGLPVDRYVPWTTEELYRDVLLEKALAI